ncbi:MAG: hypothetical protein AAGG68_06225 [Bacteroidota bacterium]
MMKRIITLAIFCCISLFLNAQNRFDYFILDIGKETPRRLFSSFSEDQKSLLLNAGIGYNYPINEKWSWASEFLLAYRHHKQSRTNLLKEDDNILGLEIIKNNFWNLDLSIPLYLRRTFNSGLVLTGGFSNNVSLIQEYNIKTIERSISSNGRSRGGPTNWLDGLEITGNLGLQAPLSERADLRFNMQIPIWWANFKGEGNYFYRLNRARFTFGLNYKLGQIEN